MKFAKNICLMVGVISLFIFALGGCGQVIMNAAKKTNPGTKYSPTIASKGDIDDYMALIENDANRPVEDANGRYFFITKQSLIGLTLIRHDQQEVLRQMFSKSSALLSPIFVWDISGVSLKVDWSATERIHAMFSEKLGLNLLPMEATRRFLRETEKASSAFMSYSPKAPGVIANMAGLRPDYILFPSYYELYFKNYDTWSRGKNFSGSLDSINNAIALMHGPGIAIEPVEMTSAFRGGQKIMNSGCRIQDTDGAKKHLDVYLEGTAIPFIKITTSRSGESKKKAEEREAREKLQTAFNLYTALAKRQSNYIAVLEEGCLKGLSGLGISGYIKSEALE